ncbi:MAG: DUF1684 domain-containing protein [Gemmatimonadota bacterium]
MPSRLLLLCVLAPAALGAQTPAAVEAERADYAQWLRTSPASPYAAVLHEPLVEDLIFGPEGSAALAGAPTATLSRTRRGLFLETGSGRRAVPRNRDVGLGAWSIRVSRSPRSDIITVFAPLSRAVEHPGWFDYRADHVVEGRLTPPDRPTERPMLGLDGVEVTASLAGTFEGEVLGKDFTLTAYRIPQPGSEEAEVSIFLRDGTSGVETYPPGRFVVLRPLGGDRYLLDFNRARNPFCAYNPRFPCPLPWPGNTLDVRLEAGELYEPYHD